MTSEQEVLVETDWVEEHVHAPNVRLVEVDVDTAAYDVAHIPGAISWNWSTQLCDVVRRDIIPPEQFRELMSESGITPDTIVVLYGDNNNWFAAWAFWQLKIFGHREVRLMNGGRNKWLAEGRPVSVDPPSHPRTRYPDVQPDFATRAMLPQVMKAMEDRSASLVDVRSELEYTGELLAPPGLPETCQRGGHIPGAVSVPWGEVCGPDGTFKSREELRRLYAARGVTADRPAIAYCRIGERSSHTWFVLKYLLGFADAQNYDGSWTEWGNLVKAPVEVGGAR
jgi:thiosulfate/3-mercaptopyruvate sulfurtransferase